MLKPTLTRETSETATEDSSSISSQEEGSAYFRPRGFKQILGRGVFFASVHLLPLSALIRIADLRGRLDYRLEPDRRRSEEKSTRRVFRDLDELELKQLVRKRLRFRSISVMINSFTAYRKLRRDYFTLEGIEHLDAALALGKGVILLTAHFGFGQFVKPSLQAYGYTCSLIGLDRRYPERPEPRSRILSWLERAFAPRPGVSSRNIDIVTSLNLRPLLKVLQSNGILVTTGDGLGTSRIIEGELLGRTVPLNGGILSLAAAQGTPVMTAFVFQSELGDSRFQLRLGSPLNPAADTTPEDMAQAYIADLERLIFEKPYFYKHLSFGKRKRRSRHQVENRYAGETNSP